jgi:uncharacterized protein
VRVSGEAVRLRVHIGANDSFAGEPLVDAIVCRAREVGLAGATALRGIAGFGESSHIHRIDLALSHDLPIVVGSSTTPTKSTLSCRNCRR